MSEINAAWHLEQLTRINKALIEPGACEARDMIKHSYSCCLAAAGFTLHAAGYRADSGVPIDLARRMAIAGGEAIFAVLQQYVSQSN